MSGNIPSLQTLQYSTKHIIKDLYNQFRTGVDRDSPRLAAMGLITSCKSLSLYFFFNLNFHLLVLLKKHQLTMLQLAAVTQMLQPYAKPIVIELSIPREAPNGTYTRMTQMFFSSFFHSFVLFLYVVCQPSVINHLICPW